VILPDTNLLIYAHNWDDPRCGVSKRWWSRQLSGTEPVVLCAPVLFGFLRITTSRHVFPRPLTIGKASALIAEWLAQPVVQFAETIRSDVELSMTFLNETGTAGNLTTDAQIAAISVRMGAIIHTADADYARFHGVRWINPLAEKRKK
jgi:toxin-antitoxin system PIN domain toxin